MNKMEKTNISNSRIDSNVKHVLLGCTGSVATMKLPNLIEKLSDRGAKHNIDIRVSVIVTDHAKHFIDMDEIQDLAEVYTEEEEWKFWNKRGDPVLHVNLTKEADILCIAPMDANTLAKISQGLCDNLLTCAIRAWDISKPLLFCPAMNTKMWEHPVTAPQIATLIGWGYVEIPCITKTLVCGDTGNGAMAEVDTIVDVIFEKLGLRKPSLGHK